MPEREIRSLLDSHKVPWSAVRFVSGEPRAIKDTSPNWQSISSWTLALGVAKPERVLEALAIHKLKIVHEILSGDHEIFDKSLITESLKSSEALLTTEKDYWREKAYFDLLDKPVYLIPLTLDWQKAPAFPEILRFFTQTLHSK